jgi:hypothetical protein
MTNFCPLVSRHVAIEYLSVNKFVALAWPLEFAPFCSLELEAAIYEQFSFMTIFRIEFTRVSILILKL